MTLSSTHVKARIKSENASFRADDIISILLDNSLEVISIFNHKVDWFKSLRDLQRRHKKNSNCWTFILRDSPDFNAIYRLKELFPDVIEIATPAQAEVETEVAKEANS